MATDEVYKVKVVASSAWVVEDRIWAPEVCIIGEGIDFTVDDTARSFSNLHTTNTTASQVGMQRPIET